MFVTAYDQYALEAFDRQAVDYVLKPVRAERLAQTVTRVQQRLGQRTMATEPAQTPTASAVPPPGFTPEQWTTLQAAVTLSTRAAHQTIAPARLSVLQVSVSSREGSAIRMLPVGEVLYFEAADKYVRVLTSDAEYLIRTPIKDLLPQLDPQVFWQIHRSTVVQAGAIVSRLYSHLFKAL